MPVVEIEVAGPQSASLWFTPLQRRLRGRFDTRVNAQLEGGRLFGRWPEEIPGVRLILDTDNKRAQLLDQLHLPEHAAVRARIERAGYSLPQQSEVFDPVDVPTWVFWLGRCLAAGLCKVLRGELPKVQGKPRLLFAVPEQENSRDRLVNRLVALLYAKLTPAERSKADEILEELGSD